MAKTPKRPTPPRTVLPSSKAELLERFKDYPGIKAWDRAYDSPDGSGSVPILLQDEASGACVDTGHQNGLKLGAVRCHACGKPVRKWYVRSVNTKQPGRVSRVRADGLIPVQISELLRSDEIADLVADSPDGLVHTGQNGTRMLYKIPLDLRNERQRQKRAALARRHKSPARVREDLANDAGHAHGLGSQAADDIYDGLEYSEKTIRTTLQEEAAGVGVDDE